MAVSPLPERAAVTTMDAARAAPPPPAPRAPLATLLDAAPAVNPTIRLDPPTGLVVTRWYEGAEIANQIPTTRQLEAYRFGEDANGLLRGMADTGTIAPR